MKKILLGMAGVRAKVRGGDGGFGRVNVVEPRNSSAQIALGERGQFRRRQDGFNFHFASREGGEGNLQPIYILGCMVR